MNEFILNNLILGLNDIFNLTNGNYSGIRFFLGLVFTILLFSIIKMRAIATMERKHLVALIGSLLLLLRYIVLIIFDWGFQIHLYEDRIIPFLLPPLDHFFYMMGLGCLGYYTLNQYNYYPGLLKKILWAIPTSITAFFIYSTVTWKLQYLSNPVITKYCCTPVDWQSHSIILIMSIYLCIVFIFNFNKVNILLHSFWSAILVLEFFRTLSNLQGIEPVQLNVIFNALELWSLPILILHFVKAYVIRLSDCIICDRKVLQHNLKD